MIFNKLTSHEKLFIGFISNPYLQNTITDQHFTKRTREGRLIVFMARMDKDLNKNPRGIASDEQTAVCIDDNGNFFTRLHDDIN